MSKGLRLRAPASLLGRTNLTLGVSGMLIAVISTIALYVFVIDPIAERSADDEAALLVLSAQTWVELPPAARPYFELELAQNHDLIISAARQELPVYEGSLDAMLLLQQKLQQRLATKWCCWTEMSWSGPRCRWPGIPCKLAWRRIGGILSRSMSPSLSSVLVRLSYFLPHCS